MEIYAKTITDGFGDESIVVFESGRQEVPLVVLDWIGVKRLLEELPNNNLLAKIKSLSPGVIRKLKKDMNDL